MKKIHPLVSICCLTYNHEKYIKEALDSFLAQKTNFQFEIVIHDDVSTDQTTNIIKEYQKKFANIQILLPKENIDSKEEKIYPSLFEEEKGKYLCI